MGMVKCLPFLLVSTAWLVLRWRKVILYALHSVLILSGVQLALGLDFIRCNIFSALPKFQYSILKTSLPQYW